ncbi:molybdate ABC transporter substrate-binding protein [Mucilaginibacter sp. 14171R-50]|uniref:molybdate ABC transporter substrate-binding protein n=1 Tax=Mucilaginibacter sp. 14171R-50 TaxID=2703789 RepID=UPI00138CF89D|nr:molybdate ABC transporter substrate-binding protein [Mucilaginibacter sp. 14171R-50]QHS54852.1 molybdate ABC transporter substrate-binding protein [Mucilaginibacter sp. 14171R-50]
MIKLFTKTFSIFFIITCFFDTADAQTIKVAIAANLQPVIKALKNDFKLRTKIDLEVISGSSGNLSAQIRNGAPYDVFLSADSNFPQTLRRDGLAAKAPAVYAQGVLIICSAQNLDLTNWNNLLMTNTIKKIAVGNPAIAPYGKAAQQALTKAGVYSKVNGKMVFGESISQVNTYITTGAVQVGFTTLSLIKDAANKQQLFYRLVNPADYAPIQQSMVLLKRAEKNTAAEKFYQYILSAPAKAIFNAYGYHTQ